MESLRQGMQGAVRVRLYFFFVCFVCVLVRVLWIDFIWCFVCVLFLARNVLFFLVCVVLM